jgi:collagenase-like PrtC family protease
MHFTISARGKPNGVPMQAFLAGSFGAIPLDRIDSLFGFVERSSLYGGRVFTRPELTPEDIAYLYEVGIGARLPLTNHFVDPVEYEANAQLLEKYHRPGNAVIATNDNLARWIKRDFPNYRLEASVIKNLKTYARIHAAMEVYDTVVLPMELNGEREFLSGAPEKDRITLFANAGCALTCPSKICYVSISRYNKTGTGEFQCSQPLKERETSGMVDFDLEQLQGLGFSRFKLLRSRPGGLTGY